MITKPYVVKEVITTHTAKNKIVTVNKTDKSQASNKKKIHPSEINLTKANNWINKYLLK